MVRFLTPKESNVYSKWIFHPTYDSFGVEQGHERLNFYKHAIPSGLINTLTPKESNVYSKRLFILHTTPSESNVDMNVIISINMQSPQD